MKQVIIAVFFFTSICLAGFTQATTIDTNTIAVIPLDSTHYNTWHLKGKTPAFLSAEQVNQADSMVNICIAENNNNGVQTSTAVMYIGIHTFKKQMVGFINDQGEILVWVNGICEEFIKTEEQPIHKNKRSSAPITYTGTDWKKHILFVNDGGFGGCFFNVIINLGKKTYSDLYINGI